MTELSTNLASPATPSERDEKRFNKFINSKRETFLLHIVKEHRSEFRFVNDGHVEDVLQAEINYIDSSGSIYIVSQEESMFQGLQVFFPSDSKLFFAYQLPGQKNVNYCSWGYKKSSATTEKLSVYFKTNDYTYLFYIDAQKPEHQFFLMEEYYEGNINHVQNLYRFIKETGHLEVRS